MPMMIVCDKLAYMPGQIITGHVVIISKSPQKVKGLTMRFIGRSSKLLGEVEGTKRYKKEVYFDEKLDIFGHDGSNTQLRVGETLYPFTFPLPPGLPSSFEWPDGNVLYFAEAKLTRLSWKDKRISTRIQVEGVYDFNLEPSSMTPIEVKRQKYAKHLLSKSGPYGFTFKSSRSGFVRGHSLPFSVEIKNLSKVDCKKLKFSLLQEVKISETKSSASLVEQMKGPAVTAGEVVTWEARLKVPGGIPPTNLGNILSYPAVIPVLYFLHVELTLKNCREEPLCIKIPVTIGTIAMHRRAVSVPALDRSSHYLPYSHNGHRVDCPMSQLLLPPSPAISTSQFSPHLVSASNHNNNGSHTQPHLPRGQGQGQNLLPPYHTYGPRNHRTPPMHMLGPVRQYEYYFEYEDSSGTTRSVTSRDNLLPRRRMYSNFASHGRPNHGRFFMPTTSRPPVRESPPPSYDEIFTRGRASTTSRSGTVVSSSANENSHGRLLPGSNIPSSHHHQHQEVIHKRALSAQLSSPSSISYSSTSSHSSSSSEEDDHEDSSLSLVLPLSNNDASGSSGDSGRHTPQSSSSSSDSDDDSSSEEEDDSKHDDGEEEDGAVSANDEFLSLNGSGAIEELNKCHSHSHDSQNKNGMMLMTRMIPRAKDEAKLENSIQRGGRPCPCVKISVNPTNTFNNIKELQGSGSSKNNNNASRNDYNAYQHQYAPSKNSGSGREQYRGDGCGKNPNVNVICGGDNSEDDT